MGLTDENSNGFYMPVAPAYGGAQNGAGFFGGDWMAWVILLMLVGGNGWGLGGFGMGGMMPWMMGGMTGFGMDYLYPWLNNSQHISDGFRDQQLGTQLSSLGDRMSAGFSDVQLGISGLGRDICQTGNGITGAVRDGFNAAEIAANGRQMATMQQNFGLQSAISGGFAQNAAATADLKYTVATEGCNDRAALSGALNTLLTHIDAKVQGVQDKLCQLELDGYKRENATLQNQLNMAAFRESQANQNALFAQGMNAEVDALYNRLKNCPVSTVPVYGSQPIFTCPQTVGAGCGCGGAAFAN